MKKVLAGLAALVIAFASGCAFEGKIVSKSYEPERKWIEIKGALLFDGKNVAVSKMPIFCEDDEDFVVEVYDKGKNLTRIFYLKNREKFDELGVGENFVYDSKIANDSDVVKKRRMSSEEFRQYAGK